MTGNGNQNVRGIHQRYNETCIPRWQEHSTLNVLISSALITTTNHTSCNLEWLFMGTIKLWIVIYFRSNVTPVHSFWKSAPLNFHLWTRAAVSHRIVDKKLELTWTDTLSWLGKSRNVGKSRRPEHMCSTVSQ